MFGVVAVCAKIMENKNQDNLPPTVSVVGGGGSECWGCEGGTATEGLPDS